MDEQGEGLVQRISALALVLNFALAIAAEAQPAAPALAQPILGGAFTTGARLLDMCRTENPACTGYVAGVVDALAPLSEPGGPLPPSSLASFCAQKLTVKQVVAEFQKFLKNNPEGLQTNAAQLIGDALHLAHPCGRP
jgi:hypothetical protein